MRLFAAFLLGDAVQSELSRVGARLARTCVGVRWVPAEQLHVTVKFLGEVPDRDVVDVAEAMAVGARRAVPFEFEIGGCGCFPFRGPVRIVWAGAGEGAEAMTRAANAICGSLEELGFAAESRAWSPHITIGRVKEDSSQGRIRTAVEACRLSAIRQRVSHVSLMQSTLSPKGSTYVQVGRAALGIPGVAA